MKSFTKELVKAIIVISMISDVIYIKAQSQESPLEDFTGIKVEGISTVFISQGNVNSIKIEGEEKNGSQVKAEVSKGILKISGGNKINTQQKTKIYLIVKNINSIDVAGITEVKSLSEITTDKLNIYSSGAGDITLDVKANEIMADISGVGDVRLSGTTENFDSKISGAGNLKAADLEIQKAKIQVSGAGTAKVNVKKSLDANISGAGSIIYKGNPEERNVEISGMGSVRQSDAESDSDNFVEMPEINNNSTKLKFKNKKIIISEDTIITDRHEENDYESQKEKHNKRNKNFHHWAGIDLGVNGFLNADQKLSMPKEVSFLELNYSKSIAFSLNFLEKDIHLYKNYINLVTGLGIEFNGYSFKHNVTLVPDTVYIAAITDSSINYQKNKLKATFINLPLMLEFNTHRDADKSVHIATGIVLGYKIGSKTKQKYETSDREYKIKIKDDYNLAPFRYSATVRAGYGNLTVFANYALSELFEKNKGPELHSFNVGLALNL